MKRFIVLFLILSLFSCHQGKQVKLIPRDKFVIILTDAHLAQGFYSSKTRETEKHTAKNNFFNNIVHKYGFTREQFDSTFKYYTVHTQEFDQIYEEVITALNKTERENFMSRPADMESFRNIWSGINTWKLPHYGEQKKIPIKVKLHGKGKYMLTFTCRTFEDDEAINPRLTLYFSKMVKGKEKKDTFQTVYYNRDNRMAIISASKDLKDSTFTNLKGFLLNHNDQKGDWKKHVEIEGLKLVFIPSGK